MLIGAASAQAQAPVKVLVFHGPPDATTTAGVAALEELGTANDFDVDATADATQIAEDNLAGYRAVVFLNTAGDLLNADQEGALQGFVEAGGGFLGIGSAAQGETSNTFFDGLIGARPTATSSTATTEQTVTSGDRVHPSTRDMPLMMNRSDVWYQWQTRPTGTVHTVARYRAPTAPAGDGTSVGGTDHPISWCRDFRGGRSFYTGMGRIAAAYGEADFKDHLLGAIEWTAGLLRTNCKATLNSSYRGTRVLSAGPESTGLATSGESHGLTVAPNGWVIYIGRGDCRTDAERGSLLGGGPLARIFDHANVNVGIGCGSVHVFDPAQYTGQENSGVTLAGKLAVYGDGGQGGERTDQNDHKMEYGLLGVTTAPDFATTGHIYLQYFPTFNPATSPPGLPVERRISKMSRPRISRFTIDRDDQEARPQLRGHRVRVRRADLQLLPRRRRHGLRLRRRPLRHHRRHELVAGHQRLLGQQPDREVPHRAADRGLPAALRRRELLLPGRAPDRGQHQRLQRQDAADQADRVDPGRGEATGRHRHDVHAADRGLAQRPEPVRRHRGRRRQGQARDLRHGPAQPEPALDRPGDRRALHGVGRPGRGRAERYRGPVDV